MIKNIYKNISYAHEFIGFMQKGFTKCRLNVGGHMHGENVFHILYVQKFRHEDPENVLIVSDDKTKEKQEVIYFIWN